MQLNLKTKEMVQNREYVKYIVYFIPKENETKDVKTIIDTLGVDIKTCEIEQDNDFFITELIALYAWKLVIIDRLFKEGAQKISIERIQV